MKNLENLTGVKTLNKRVQQNIKGGKMQCNADGTCPPWGICIKGVCELHMPEF
ncbi:hypothetical protein [Marinifilum sp. N1E240]|uniref:hypothetical protein n=1 Tax=Marinifilum sp. N1E240 TaxID=2608082 RepID=UPI00186B8D41|nr:hypothetical protein [Marinifilum sp. N1E240]